MVPIKNSKRVVYGFLILFTVLPSGAGAQESVGPESSFGTRIVTTTSTKCVEDTRTVHEITPQFAFNDFGGHGQAVGALTYSFSQCIGSSANRWFAHVGVAHVNEANFSAESALVGIGLELHPLREAAGFTVAPVIRVGREDFHPGFGNNVYDAAVTVSDVVLLRTADLRIQGRDVRVATSQFEWAARAEYTNRDFTGPSVLVRGVDREALTYFGQIGLDQALGTRWRWKASLAYQTLPGPAAGFASVGLSFRNVNASYTNYNWNFSVSGQFGDADFRGLVFSISHRL